MAVWTNVFRSKPNRLVRIASWLHASPYYSDLLLKILDLNQSVDALATRPTSDTMQQLMSVESE